MTGGEAENFLGDQTIQPDQTVGSIDCDRRAVLLVHDSITQRDIALDPEEITGCPERAGVLWVSGTHATSAGPYKGS